MESSIVFTFTDQLPANARLICEIQAQEIAHAFGLDHERLAADPMSYLPFDGNRVFQDKIAACGENVDRPCGLNGTVCRRGQNSVQLLNERLGSRFDATPPTVAFVSPKDGDTIPPGALLKLDATDNIIVRSAKVYVDGTLVGDVTTEPFELMLPALPDGLHRIAVEVTDGKQTTTAQIGVQVQRGAPDPADTDTSDGDVIGGCSTGRENSGVATVLLLLFALGFGLQTRRAHR
jgi:hypothetical protein